MLRSAWLCLAVVASFAVQAQSSTDPVFQVELVVFSNLAPPELYYRHPGEPSTARAIDLLETAAGAEMLPLLAVADHGVELATPIELVNTFDILGRNGAYDAILHTAWRQKADVFGRGRDIRVYGGTVIDYEAGAFEQEREPVFSIDGTASLEQGQYLHLTLNLAYHRATPRSRTPGHNALTVPFMADRSSRFDRDRDYQTYRIIERRRLRLGRYEYFDHAQFGVIAVVTRVQSAPATENEPTP